jgi:hypothetical protein
LRAQSRYHQRKQTASSAGRKAFQIDGRKPGTPDRTASPDQSTNIDDCTKTWTNSQAKLQFQYAATASPMRADRPFPTPRLRRSGIGQKRCVILPEPRPSAQQQEKFTVQSYERLHLMRTAGWSLAHLPMPTPCCAAPGSSTPARPRHSRLPSRQRSLQRAHTSAESSPCQVARSDREAVS